MGFRFDHVVIAVNSLDVAVADFAQLGFTVIRGGKHASGATHNALICFKDGSYIELMASTGITAKPGTEDYTFMLENGEGVVAYVLGADDIAAAAQAMRGRGVGVGEPVKGSRTRHDGTEIIWKSARVGTSMSPFFIEDVTAHNLRVPDEEATISHANGITGVSGVKVLTNDLDRSVARYETMLGMTSPREYGGVKFELAHAFRLQLALPTTETGKTYLKQRGSVPYEIYLAGGTVERMDASLTHGAHLLAAPRETER